MRIHLLPIEESHGHLLLHNVADEGGQKVLKKGTCISDREVAILREVGLVAVEVAVLDEEDVHEDEAAATLAAALLASEPLLSATRAVGGRVNFHVEQAVVLQVDAERLTAFNMLQGVTLATRPQYAVAGPALDTTQVATLKIIPYAIPRATLDEAAGLIKGTLRVTPLRPQRVALLITGEEASHPRVQRQFETPTRERLQRLGADLATVETVVHREEAIGEAARRLLSSHDGLIIGGQTSVMDIEDTTPRALARGGLDVVLHGAPVEPGNLLALAYCDHQWVLCAPGCAKSPQHNVVDLLLPRLIGGERLERADIAALGVGGLL
jgi:molybdenum cofactor cytidylyltransferase